jgi:hypothetical protein
MTVAVATFARAVTTLVPVDVLDVLRELGRDAATWRALARHTPHERWYRRLSADDSLDVWLLGWDAHQGVDLHDHGGSSGGLLVLEGELLETATARDATDGLVEHRLAEGTATAFGPGHVHWVVNASPAPATSVHVYSPPLRSMGFYEYAAPGALVASHTEAAFAARPDHGGL